MLSLASLILNCEGIIEFLKSNGKKFHNMWLRKKKDLLRLLMLVVVEAIFDTKERQAHFIRKTCPLYYNYRPTILEQQAHYTRTTGPLY